MRSILLALFIGVISSRANAINLWVNNNDTLVMHGTFTSGDLNKIKNIDLRKIKSLVINSSGGEINATILASYLIHRHNIPVTETHECLSACANWIFLPAVEKHLKHGAILGFHSGTPHFDINEAMITARHKIKNKEKSITPMDLHNEMMGKSGINQQIFMDS